MSAHFVSPEIQDNPNGWGPCQIPEKFKDMPYQPFSKGDRLGKISDWTGATYQDRRYISRYQSQYGGGTQYAYYHDEDETSFRLVDTAKVQRPIYQRGRGRFNQRGRGGQNRGRDQKNIVNMQVLSKTQKSRERDRQRQVRKWQKQFGGRGRFDSRNQQPVKIRESSVIIRHEWSVLEEMDFTRMTKLSLPGIEDPEDLAIAGELEFYDKRYDRVTTKNEKRLKRINRIFHKVTTTDDPVIRKLTKAQGNVFATDTILATIMCSTRSSYSWDVVVQRIGNRLFFDKRDDSEFDLLTVSETANEPPQEEGQSLNSPRNLALEATFINHNFSQQVLKSGEKRHKFETKNPFTQDEDEQDVASVAYRYRKWNLGDGIELVARCEHDAAMVGPNNDIQFINIKALNEWDCRFSGGVDWRAKLDTQRGAVLATELKNNSGKLAKWTVCALLAGSDQLKFGYVSRLGPRNSSSHVILGAQQFKPAEFAGQINLSMDNGWGILRYIIDTCMKFDEGKYLILKDPNRPVIRIYDIPDGTFESDEDDESDDDDDDDEDSSDSGVKSDDEEETEEKSKETEEKSEEADSSQAK